ncbi:class III poly(R)-hydroxyalkanoic acid synthase subunit PhaE [Chiayiivirga flava]|uniref:Poly(3-hydroxyalkanoate) polymerase subunit PhaE n=1 Tax=Chiayiivirga flava TaxID=659595 RepID=A0A7W8FYB2_9GAMM|nr:class III poly(R)-hydroxyalkanoic acid synthase subunit PhaE [Chiayiivirga flava]MBB5206931.1 class III poly(R)-hydroxyalkanoic acid synthase PhaE subunit [Chiayiivirga flava]
MSGHDHGAAGFEQLARQYWSAFGDFARTPSPDAAIPGWKEGLAWWTQRLAPGSGQLDAALERMNAQSAHLFGLMQQVAAGLAGRDAAPEQISRAWQRALGDAFGGNGVADMFRGVAGVQGFDQWLAQVQPWLRGWMPSQAGNDAFATLAQWQRAASPQAWQQQFAPLLAQLQGGASPQAWREQAEAALRLPTFGLAREHQERWQALAQALLDHQQASAAFSEMLAQVGKRAFERFESKLEERAEPGRQLDSARALFDLWIDAAEDAWQQIALTDEFRAAYGSLANSQMRLRAAVQTEIEHIGNLFGLPSRTEMDASHRKVAALERELRRLRSELDEAAHAARTREGARPAPTRARAAPVEQMSEPEPEAYPEPASKPRRVRSRGTAVTPKKQAAAKPSAKRKASGGKRRMAVLPMVAAPRALGKSAASGKKVRK